MDSQRCKGSRDLLPADMAAFRHIERVFTSTCLRFGYREVRTPTIEYLHLFTSVGTLTPSMLSGVYSFLDWDGWSGERVVLRPESTIPTARLYIENLLQDGPARLFYVENIFSFEPTGQESRERWQCGAEMMGNSSPSADAELILLALELLTEMGTGEIKVSLSHAGMIRALLQETGLPSSEQSRLFDRIMEGHHADAVAEVTRVRPDMKDPLSMLFDLDGSSPAFLANLKTPLVRLAPKLEASIDDFIGVTRLLTDLGCKYRIDMTSGKGFEYYTGIMFRFDSGADRVGGGGRYDDLIPLMGGGHIPACGFAVDANRLMCLVSGHESPVPSVLVRTPDDAHPGDKLVFEIAGMLRRSGYVAELDQGYLGPTPHRWALYIRRTGDSVTYVLTDQSTGKATELDSPSEILGILQVANAGKTGPS